MIKRYNQSAKGKPKYITNADELLKDYMKLNNNLKRNSKSKEKLSVIGNQDNYENKKPLYIKLSKFSGKRKEDLTSQTISNFNTGLKLNIPQPSGTSKLHGSKLKELKANISQLEKEKMTLESEILEYRRKIKLIKREELNKRVVSLQKEKEECKKTANHYLHLCSQLAEEVIMMRNQLDNYSHNKK